jgi:hypothetical protein
MARYVLLVIEDNAAADAFVKGIEQQNVFFSQGNADGTGSYGYLAATVRAVWMKPTKFCECAKPGDRSVRGEKWGLYVHRDCGKPKKGQWQHPRNLYSPVPSAAAQAEHLGAQEPANLKPGERDIYLGVQEPEPTDGVTNAPVGAPYRRK